jgi:uncharacterized protein (TIGR03083 family)
MAAHVEVENKTARQPGLERPVAMKLAETEYGRVVDLLATLTAAEWSSPTVCPGWDVRAMAGHLLGMAQMAASVPEMVRQQVGSLRTGKASGTPTIDALTALQVAKNAPLSTTEVVDQLRLVGPRAARGRRRVPALIRRRTMPEIQDTGERFEWWTFGYLFDVILTRDPFMHRIDISQATGAPMQVTAEHEGVLVDDVVSEWAGRHGQPYSLRLTAPAGGTWGDEHGEPIVMDALEFCRVLSGRAVGTGLLATRVPF